MSEVYVKRQKLAKEMRKMEIENYFTRCRNAMEHKYDNSKIEGELTLDELDRMYDQLQKQNDSIQSVLNYLSVIKIQRASTISSPILLVRVKKLLKYLNNGQDLQHGIVSANVIASKVVSESIKHPNLIEKCFQELLELVIQHQFKLHEIWPTIGLIRHQVCYQKSFFAFMRYIQEYQGEINPILGMILVTFVNFTSLDEQHLQNLPARLSSNCYIQIVETLITLFQNFILGSNDIKHSSIILKNIIAHFGIQRGIEICRLDKTMEYFLQAINEQNQNKTKLEDSALKEVLELIGIVTCGSIKQTTKLINSNPTLINILCSLLPIQRPFKNFITPGTIHWIHTNQVKIMGAFLSLCNLASLQVYGFSLLSTDTLKAVIQMSRYSSDAVKGEVAIFIWNLIVANEVEHTQIFCQSGILTALSNVLKAQHCTNALKYGLKSIVAVIKRAKSFPPNNLAWIYNSKTIKLELKRNESMDQIQKLMWSKSKQLRDEAELCLNLIKEDQQ